MSASNSQILDQTEPLRGVKHMKPPVKPPVKPKPLVPPRPKEIQGSSTENKSPLLSPTCGPCSPTLDIPSALKISQLTGPQPYGTRRTSLKRWSSSVGEDVTPENNALSPMENRSIDLPAKITAQPLSAPLKPLQTGTVWKGKSPFMLTTRGWGEQRLNQSKESEAVSLKSSSSVKSKDTDTQKKETSALKEDSNSHSRITPEGKLITHVQESVIKSEKSPSTVSEDVTMGSSELGSSNRPAQVKKCKKELPSPLQSDIHFESNKQASQDDHQKDIIKPIGSKVEKEAQSVTRESLQVQKSQTDDGNEKMAIVYDYQIPDVRSGRGGHALVCDDAIIVDQGQPENRGKNHQPEAHVDPCDPKQIADVIPKYAERTNISYDPPSQHEKEEPKDISVTSVRSPPKPKERKKPSVQFIVPKADDPAERQGSLECTRSESEKQETKEHKQKEDGNADMRRWHGEDGIEEIPVSYEQRKTDYAEYQEIDEPPGHVRTQITNYTVTIDDISKDPTEYTSHRSDHHTVQENTDVCKPDNHGSSFHHKETQIAKEEDESSISYTTKLNENVEYGNKDINLNEPDDVVEDQKRQPEEDPAVKNVDYTPRFSHTPPDSSPRSEHDNYKYSSHDSGTTYVHHYKTKMNHTEFDDIKKPSHMSIESQSEDKILSQEINTDSIEFQPPSVLTQSQEELTQLKKYESNSSKSKLGFLDLESSKSEEVQLSNFEDPTYKVIQSTEKSNISDHEGGLQYYNIYSQNVQDGEKIKHIVDESVDRDYSHSHVEEPLHVHAQSEEPVSTYEPSEGLVSTFTPSKELVHTYEPFEEQVHTYIASEEPVRTYAQSEEHEHTYGTSEEPVHKYTRFEEPMQDCSQSEEESHGYAVIKKPKYEFDQSENHLKAMYEQREKQVCHNAESEELTHCYEPSKTQTLTYEQHMKPIYTYDEIKESYLQETQTRETERVYDQVYEHGKETFVKYVQPEDSAENIISHVNTESHYQQSQIEDTDSKNSLSEKIILSEMPLEMPYYRQTQTEVPDYRQTQTEDLDYQQTQSGECNYQKTQPQEPNYQQKNSEEAKYQQIHSEEPNYQYKHSGESYYQEEHSEESNYQQKHSEEPKYQQIHSEEPNYQYKHSGESYYQEEHSEEPNYQQKLSEEPKYQQIHSEEPNYQYKHSEESYYHEERSEEPNYQEEYSEEPNYQQKHSEEPKYQQIHSEEPNYQYKHSKESYYHEECSEEPNYQEEHLKEANYQNKHSEESYYKEENSKEPNYQHKQNYQDKHADDQNDQQQHSDVPNYQETRSEELNFRYAQPEILLRNDKGSGDSHLTRYYSEQSEEKDGQIQEGKTKMFGENNYGLTESVEGEYINLQAVEKDSGHVASAEQDKAKNTLEKYLEQQDSDSAPENYHHEDDSTTETYDKKLLSKEQTLEYSQKKEPKTLYTHTVESELSDVVLEQQDHTDFKVTDKRSQFLESPTEETQDTCAEDNLDKHTLNEKHINGHSALEEFKHIEDRSGGPKLSDETHEESPVDTASDTEELPDENFDFLEGTNVLDTSLMRGRASLGKKRYHRTPVAGTCAAQEETDPEYWMFRDSTEPRCSPGKDSDAEEKEETSTDCTPENSPTSVKSPTKKGGIFSGIISPSILKGRLKSRKKASEGETTQTESKESQDPTSPAKDKSESSSHSLSWLQALKKKKKKNPK